jgi:hypothetical protein
MTKSDKKQLFLASALLILIYYLFWGPLFPWNPIKAGYEKISSPFATVYITKMTDKDSVVYKIDQLLHEEENFHNLTYKDEFKIIIVSEESNMKRFVPWLAGSGYSVSLSLINVIYIGPIARKSTDGIKRYLKHELSHMLIAQNTTFEKGRLIHEQAWLSEGMAEYYSGHQFYSKSEFINLCRMKNFQFNSLSQKSPLDMSLNELKFNYTYYGLFIEFLINHYGTGKFHQYLTTYIENPEDYKDHFITIYESKLTEILNLFKHSLKL